jgi:hypothetical protein
MRTLPPAPSRKCFGFIVNPKESALELKPGGGAPVASQEAHTLRVEVEATREQTERRLFAEHGDPQVHAPPGVSLLAGCFARRRCIAGL